MISYSDLRQMALDGSGLLRKFRGPGRQRRRLAIDRMAALLATDQTQADGNPDQELWQDWFRWLRGEEGADPFDVFYPRKQQRDLKR